MRNGVQNMDIFSHSKLETFDRCLYLYQLNYIRNIELKDINMDAIDIGSAFHYGINTYFTHGDFELGLARWGHETLPEWEYIATTLEDHGSFPIIKEMIEEDEPRVIYDWDQFRAVEIRLTIRTARELCKRMVIYMAENGYEVCKFEDGRPMTEIHLNYEGNGFKFTGFVDTILRHKATGAMYITDFKVVGGLKSDTEHDYNQQLAIYQWLLKETMGLLVNGSCTMQIHRRLPSLPNVNKNGSIARTKIHTDWATYKSVILEQGLDLADYEDMRVYYEKRPLVRPLIELRTEREMDIFWSNTVEKINMIYYVQDMLSTREKQFNVYAPRSISRWNCAYCQARDFCNAEMYGHSTDFYIAETKEERKEK